MTRTNSAESAPEKEEKAAKTLSLIVISFIVCWLPMTISFFVFAIKKDRGFTEEILDVFIILSHFNSGNSFELINLRFITVKRFFSYRPTHLCLSHQRHSRDSEKLP